MTSVAQTQFTAEARFPASSTKYRRQNTPAETKITTGTNTVAILSGKSRDGRFLVLRRADDIDYLLEHGLSGNVLAGELHAPSRHRVPQYILLPVVLDTSALSPVSMDSSAWHVPSMTAPSIGTRSPPRMIMASSGLSSSMPTVCTVSPREDVRRLGLEADKLSYGLRRFITRGALYVFAEEDQRQQHSPRRGNTASHSGAPSERYRRCGYR